tara:strand:- start:3576 stop:5141 length:1566 start_codon:yes stop_codon:yes gene_type:complete
MDKKKELTTEEIFDLAVKSYKNKNFHQAEKLYKKVLTTHPDHSNTQINLGNVYQKLDKYNEAKDCYEKVIQLNPDDPDAYYNLGNVYKKLDKQQEAINYYNKTIQINPNYLGAYNNLGNVFKNLGEYKKAIYCYNKAIEINQNNSDIYNNIGLSYWKLGKTELAVDSYQTALTLRSNIKLEVEKKLHPATTFFFLELTNKCNFHCEFCPSDSQTRLHGYMELSLAKKIFDEISEKKLVSQVHLHLMGEPTLHPKLNEILNYAKGRNVKINLTTNGSTLVKKKLPKILESISGSITASLMTPTQDTYDIRGDVGLSWDRYIDNFRLLVREHLTRISRGEKIDYNISMRIMVTEKTRKGTVKVMDCSKDIQDNWKEWSNFVQTVENELGLKNYIRETIDADKTFSSLNETNEVSYNLQQGLTLQFWRAFTFANSRVSDNYKLEPQEKAKYCYHPFTDFGVLWNGDVTLCCLDHDGTLEVGNVRNNSIEEVLKTSASRKLRASMYSLEALHPTCKKCQSRLIEQ